MDSQMPTSKPGPVQGADGSVTEGALSRAGIRFTAWAEKWFPDAFIGSMAALQRFVEGSVATLPTSS